MASSFVVPSLSRSSQTDEKAVVVQMDSVASRRRPSPAETNELLVVLGIPVYKLSPLGQFLTLCSGILLFYLLYGYVQEWIFRTEGLKPFGLYLTLVQFGFYTIFGSVEFRMREDATRRIPLRTYALLAFLTVSTMGLSNASLGYLNYPTQVIFKCCKLIPVMIGGIFIQNKRYGMIDFSAVVCMSAGLVLFTLADSSVSPNFDKTGVVFISSALCADAIIGNVQEKTMKAYSASNTEVVLYSYGIGFIYLLFCLVLNGGLVDAFRAYAKNPLKTYGLAAVFSITGYLGILFVLALVRSFGALLAVTVTTFRKAISIILSFLFFTKPFTLQYIWSGIVILLGIALNVYSKNYAKINAFFSSKHRSASQSV